MEKASYEKTLKEKRNYQRVILFSYLFVFIFVLFSVRVHSAQAADLYFSPAAGSYTVNQNFSIGVYVSSSDQAMNAASSIISFPRDKLEVISLSKDGSIFNLWVREPSFSNSAGTVSFEGIILNPGFTGLTGKIITVNFKAKAVGDASLAFSSGSVLANDGKGTSILLGLGSAALNVSAPVVGPQAPKATTPSKIIGTPLAPKVSSPTHPDPEKWYASNSPQCAWSMPKDAKGVALFADRNPNTNPGIRSDGLFGSHTYKDVDDGIWYFHVRLRNNGGWGGISHFRFQIDTETPSHFAIKEVEREALVEPRVKFIFDANDKLSGIDYYKVKIDDESWQIWQDDGSHIYETPVLSQGTHTLVVEALDKAENSLIHYAEFVIEALEPPTVNKYPRRLQSGEILAVEGNTYPGAQVVIWLQREKDDPQSQTVPSDNNGNFIFIAGEKLSDGIYRLWAEVIDERGARSKPSEKLTIVIERLEILKIGSWVVNFFAVIIPLVALIFLLLALLLFGWRKLSLMRKKVKKDTRDARHALHTAFNLLKEDIREQIKLLEKTRSKRKLTKEEDQIIKQLQKSIIDDAEKFIGKEIEDIEKEVK